MILPPFQGISSQYDEQVVKEAIISHLSSDVVTFTAASNDAGVTYLIPDIVTFSQPSTDSAVTYLATDVVSLGELSAALQLTYAAADILTYDPPPETPEITRFMSTVVEDSMIDFTWNIPWERRSPLLNYILEYTDCFLSNVLTEDNLRLTEESYSLLTHDDNIIANENNESLAIEPDFALITENYKSVCNYQQYDHRRILKEDENRVIGENFLLTENSSGIGLINNLNVENLENGQSYIFRIAAVNSIGTGEYGYTNILEPIGPNPFTYCNLTFFMQPNSLVDVSASIFDHSCRRKTVFAYEGVTPSSDSKFGVGSLYFDGVYQSLPVPGTRSHLQVNHNNSSTGEDWSLKGDFTIEMWIKPDRTSATESLISAHNPYIVDEYGYPDSEYSVFTKWNLYRQSQKIKFDFKGQVGSDQGYPNMQTTTLETENITLSTTEFSHIAVSRFNNIIRLYVNGEEKDKKTATYDVANSGKYMIIGAEQRADYQSSDEYNINRGVVYNAFKGKIDDVMLVDKARYAKNFTPIKYAESLDCASCGGN